MVPVLLYDTTRFCLLCVGECYIWVNNGKKSPKCRNVFNIRNKIMSSPVNGIGFASKTNSYAIVTTLVIMPWLLSS